MYTHDIALNKDILEIESLMDLSINKMLGENLNSQQLEAAKESMGLDTKLIEDKTYFLVKKDDSIVGAGGYSIRKNLIWRQSHSK